MTRTETEITCYGQTRGCNWAQESYETASRDAGRRAKTLRATGYRVATEAMGLQVTPVGLVKMTLVHISGTYDQIVHLPEVRIERL